MSFQIDQHNLETLEELVPNTWFLNISNVIKPELPLRVFQVNLMSLTCWEIGLVRLPKEIGNLVWLQALALEGNCLTMLPEEIGQLENLRNLDLARNRLIKLPKSIVNLKLHTCLLACNQLTTLPKGFGKNYQHIDLSDNPLQHLPDLGAASVWTNKSFACKHFTSKLASIPLTPGLPEIAAINCQRFYFLITTLK